MTLVVMYDMTAQAGSAEAFATALQDLGAVVGKLPGCADVAILTDTSDAQAFVFIEKWESQQAYDSGAALMPPDAFAVLKPLLAAKPVRRVLQTA